MFDLEKPNYLIFIDIACEVSKVLPLHSSKFSRKDYNQRQLMTLYILKQKSKLSYDNFIEDFKTRDCAIEDLQLKRVPSASAIKMFIKRIEVSALEQIIADCICLTRKRKLNTAIDSTGFQLEDGSYSYLKRLGIATKKRKNLKVSCCVDTDKHLFLAAKIRKKNRHDNVDFKPLIAKVKKKTRKPIKVNLSDKAYDAEKNHEFAEREGFVHVAPLKNKVPVWRTKGVHRKKLRRNFPKKKYNRRSIIENMWFCVKRLCGNVVKAKKWIMQKKEMLGKIIAYNINRLVQLLRI